VKALRIGVSKFIRTYPDCRRVFFQPVFFQAYDLEES